MHSNAFSRYQFGTGYLGLTQVKIWYSGLIRVQVFSLTHTITCTNSSRETLRRHMSSGALKVSCHTS